MNTPHVLTIRYQFQLGTPYTFTLRGMNIAAEGPMNQFNVRLKDTVQPVEWTVDGLSPPADNTVTVTATPTAAFGKGLDGGGDGSLTITVNNGVADDPDPPIISVTYS